MDECRLPCSEEKATRIATALLQLADWLQQGAEKVIEPGTERRRWQARSDLARNTARLLLQAEDVEPALLEPASGAFDTGGKR